MGRKFTYTSSPRAVEPASKRCLILACSIVSMLGCKQRVSTTDDSEIFSVLEEAVVAVSLVGARDSVLVRRDTANGRLRYQFKRAGRETKCGPSPRRDAAVRRLLVVHTKKVLETERVQELEDMPSDRWIELTVSDVIENVEPFRLSLLEPSERSKPVEAFRREVHDGFTVDPALIELWWMDCSAQRNETP